MKFELSNERTSSCILSQVAVFTLPIFGMLSFVKQLLKYTDCFWTSVQRADIKYAHVLR